MESTKQGGGVQETGGWSAADARSSRPIRGGGVHPPLRRFRHPRRSSALEERVDSIQPGGWVHVQGSDQDRGTRSPARRFPASAVVDFDVNVYVYVVVVVVVVVVVNERGRRTLSLTNVDVRRPRPTSND